MSPQPTSNAKRLILASDRRVYRLRAGGAESADQLEDSGSEELALRLRAARRRARREWGVGLGETGALSEMCHGWGEHRSNTRNIMDAAACARMCAYVGFALKGA